MRFTNEIKNNQGVSLITLSIIIIVILIIASITIIESSNTVEKGELSKFLVEFSNLEEAFYAKSDELYGDLLKNGYDIDFDKVYYMSAKNINDVNTHIVQDTISSDIEVVLKNAGIKGNHYYEIQMPIEGYRKQSSFVEEGEKIYVTDEGDLFIIPAFLGEVMDEQRYYFNSQKYVVVED